MKSIASILLFVALAIIVSAETWDIASGYSGTRNPNGAWSYGRKWSVDASSMDLFGVKWGKDGWYLKGTLGAPSIMHLNWSSAMPGPFLWNGDNSRGYCTVRWTCQTSAKFSIKGQFYAADSRGMDTHVYVVVNGSIRFTDRIQTTTQSAPFSESTVDFNPGDFVDFVIVWGGTGNPGTSSVTGIDANITPVYAPATATSTVVSGFVVGTTISDSGAGYTNVPNVRFIGGGGSGVVGRATVSNGVVTAVNILNPGRGYTNAPIVVISPPFITPPKMHIADMSSLSFSNLAVGTSYQVQSIALGQFSDWGGAFTATNSTYSLLVPGAASSGGYRLAAAPVPVQAQATAEVFGGFVTGATVTRGGSGYGTDVPNVTIVNNGAGSNATAVATIRDGIVVGITIVDPGIGYINGARIIIDSPSVVESWPQAVSRILKLDLSGLSPYENYRIQFCPNPGGTWINHGEAFTPTSSTSFQYHDNVGEGGFFRVAYEP